MGKPFKKGKPVKPKKKCCKSSPMCKKCPIVLDRLCKAGYLERRHDGKFVQIEKVKKKTLKRARTERKPL